MGNVVLTHAAFQRPPVLQKRRRGRLPAVVTWIATNGDRLKPGTRGELKFKDAGDPDNGKAVTIADINLADSCPIHVVALGEPLTCDDGTPSNDLWVKPSAVRRVWTGLTENERAKLRLWRSP